MDIIQQLVLLEKEAADFGFEWETAEQILDQIKSELAEIKVHLVDGDQKKLQEEIGDLLHGALSLCVFCQFDAKDTLRLSSKKFATRLRLVQKLAKQDGYQDLKGQSFKKLMEFWDKAKTIAYSEEQKQ